jgi:hypothetical protein
MARLARVVAVGEPHHPTQRGNNRQPTFLDDHDCRTYCRLLAEHSKRAGIRVLRMVHAARAALAQMQNPAETHARLNSLSAHAAHQ